MFSTRKSFDKAMHYKRAKCCGNCKYLDSYICDYLIDNLKYIYANDCYISHNDICDKFVMKPKEK